MHVRLSDKLGSGHWANWTDKLLQLDFLIRLTGRTVYKLGLAMNEIFYPGTDRQTDIFINRQTVKQNWVFLA